MEKSCSRDLALRCLLGVPCGRLGVLAARGRAPDGVGARDGCREVLGGLVRARVAQLRCTRGSYRKRAKMGARVRSPTSGNGSRDLGARRRAEGVPRAGLGSASPRLRLRPATPPPNARGTSRQLGGRRSVRSISGCGGREQELPGSFDAHAPRGGDGGGVESSMAERKTVS